MFLLLVFGNPPSCGSWLSVVFTWRHDSILNCLAKALQAMNLGNIYADIPEFRNPSVLTGDVSIHILTYS